MRFRLLGQYINAPAALLAAVECLAFVAAFYSALVLRLGVDILADPKPRFIFAVHSFFFAISLLASFMAFGLYSARLRARLIELSLRIVAASVSGTVIIATLQYLFPSIFFGRGVMAFSIFLAIGGSILIRLIFQNIVDEGMLKRRVLVYGAGKAASGLAFMRRRADRRGFNLVGFVLAEAEDRVVPEQLVLQPSSDLVQLCQQQRIDEIVLAMDDRRRAFPSEQLLSCRLAGIQITEMAGFLERETSRLPLELMNPSWLILGRGFHRNPLRLATSRCLDLLASAVLVTLLSPVIALAAIAIKCEDGLRAPVFYRQPRVGLNGRVFDLLKFRSMHSDAESDGVARWAQKGDNRVTRVGAVMRVTRVDELPQLLNVLVGQMSMVGPRPERPQFVQELTKKIPYYGQRHTVRPGITGWAQLCYPYGASEEDALQKLQYDLYYIKNNNLIFDVSILIQTVEVVCFGKGAR